MSRPSATELMGGRAGVSWLVLIIATLVSYTLGADHGIGSATVVTVLGIAAIKVRLIGLDFMELRSAPTPLRAIFEIYCLLLWAVLSGLYLLA
jgi:Prokaryotic Cytochrome C oxidase subunit IV